MRTDTENPSPLDSSHLPGALAVLWRWLIEPAVALPEPKHRRSRLLAWLLLLLLVFAGLAFLRVVFLQGASIPLRGFYTALIVASMLVLSLALGLNRWGHYMAAAAIVITCTFAGPWVSLVLDPAYLRGDAVPLAYMALPVLLCSLLFSQRATAVLAIVQFVGLAFLVVLSPAISAISWIALLAFILLTSALSIVANHISRRDLAQIDKQRRQLAESETRFRLLAENMTDVIWTMDKDMRVTYVSPAVRRMFGYAPEEAIGHTLDQSLTPESYALALRAWKEEMAAEENGTAEPQRSRVVELEYFRKDGSTFWGEMRANALRDSNGALIGIMGITRDINESRRTALTLARRAEELEALYRTSLDINAQLDVPILLQEIVERAVRLLDAPMGGLYLLEPDGETLKLVVSYRLPVDYTGTCVKLGEGLSGRIAQTGQPLMVEDYRHWEGQADVFTGSPFRRVLGVPLKIGDKVIGVINITDVERTDKFTDDDVRLATLFADQAAIAVENARLYVQVKRLATIDDLTGVYNRRGLFQVGEREVDRALRFGRPLSAVILDIDMFKQINDTYGHNVGDLVLRALSGCLVKNIRNIDIIGRYGGDEFVLLLPETNLDHAIKVARRLRGLIATSPMPIGRDIVHITASLGVVKLNSTIPNLTMLIEQADWAQYQAKQSGRNQVAVYGQKGML